MAKKKTAEKANLKGSPVLRGGDDPTPETPVITKSYSIRDDWKDSGIVNYVAFKSVNGEVQDLTVNGEAAGGGGMRTCTVNMTNDSQATIKVYLPYIDSESPTNGIWGVMELESGMDIDVQVIMNEEGDTAGSYATGQYSAAGGGDVEVYNKNIFVRGDGTLSFS